LPLRIAGQLTSPIAGPACATTAAADAISKGQANASDGIAVLQDPTGTMEAGLHASALEAHGGIGPGTILYLINVRFSLAPSPLCVHSHFSTRLSVLPE